MKKIHLVPPAIIDKVESMMNENTRPESREIHAASLEAVRDYCLEALKKYENIKSTLYRKRK